MRSTTLAICIDSIKPKHTFSAIAYTVACVKAPTVIGITLASTTRKLFVPYTFRSVPTTPPILRGAIAAVPTGWNCVPRLAFTQLVEEVIINSERAGGDKVAHVAISSFVATLAGGTALPTKRGESDLVWATRSENCIISTSAWRSKQNG